MRRVVGSLGLLLTVTVAGGCGTSATARTASAASTATRPPRASNGSASFIGQAPNAEILIAWTRAGSEVSGALQEALRKERASAGVESTGRAFTGTISGNGLTLTLNEGLGSTSALVGTLKGEGFSLTLPGVAHQLVTVTFVPGTVADYNHAVLELEGKAEQGPGGGASPGVPGSDTVPGAGSPSDQEVREELRRMRAEEEASGR